MTSDEHKKGPNILSSMQFRRNLSSFISNGFLEILIMPEIIIKKFLQNTFITIISA